MSGQLATARLRQRTERERLIRSLGLWGAETGFRLPDSVAALPKAPQLTLVERSAVST